MATLAPGRRPSEYWRPMAAKEEKPTEALVLDFERPVVELERKIDELRRFAKGSTDLEREIKTLEARVLELQQEIFAELTPWQTVQLSRHPSRPYTLDYLGRFISDFTELHGDRQFGDDPAIVAGLGTFEGIPVVCIGHQKGRTTKENVRREVGMPNPAG